MGLLQKICAGSFSILLASSATIAAPEKLTLTNALRYALQNSPELDSQTKYRAIREFERQSAVAKFLPSIDLTGAHGIAKTYPMNPTDPWSSSMGLTLTENLYDNGRSIANLRISDLNEQYSALNAVKTRDKLILEVTNEFYNLSLLHKLFAVRGEQLRLLQQRLGSVDNQYHQGLRTRIDFLRFRTEVQRTEIDFRNSDVAIHNSENALRKLIGRTVDSTPVEFQIGEPPTFGAMPAVELEVENTFEVRLAKIQTAISPLQTSLVERKFWPQIDLTAGGNYQNLSYLGSNQAFSTNQTYGWNALVTLNFNLLDWGIRSRDVAIAQNQQSIQENQLRQTRLELKETLGNLNLELAQVKANCDATKELQDAEQETYRIIQQQYSEAKVSYLDLITSLKSLLNAKAEFFTAHFQLAQSLAKYNYHLGNLYEAMAL